MPVKRKSTFAAESTSKATALELKMVAASHFAPLSKFSDDKSFLAAVDSAPDSLRLRVWNTKLGSLVADFSAKSSCNGLTFIELPKDKLESSTQLGVILALNSGDSILYSISNKKIVSKLTGFASPATDVSVLKNNQKICFTSFMDGLIIKWDATTGAELDRFTHNSSSQGSLIKLATDSSRLVTASRQIKVWNLENNEIISTLPGHASDITSICLTGDFLATAAEGDRYIVVWDLRKQPYKQLSTHSLVTYPISISLTKEGTLAALTEDGIVHLWQNIDSSSSDTTSTNKKKKNRSVALNKNAEFKIIDISDNQKTTVPVLSASFEGQGLDIKLVFAYGSPVKPFIDRESIFNEGGIVRDITIERNYQENSILIGKEEILKANRESDKSTNKENAAVISNHSTIVASGKLKEEEETIEEKLQNVKISADADAETERLRRKRNDFHVVQGGKKASTSSFNQLLAQAVHSGDSQLLDQALQIQDIDMIFRSVGKLIPGQAVQLLTELLDRLEKRPARAREIVEWIRAVLITHAGYLATVPQVTAKLGNLRQVLQDRQQVLPLLNALGGRLDLMMSQIIMRNRRKAQNDGEIDEDDDVADEYVEFHDSDDEESELSEYEEEYFYDDDEDDEEDEEDDEDNEDENDDDDSMDI